MKALKMGQVMHLVFSEGKVVACGRLVLLGLYLVGLSAVVWGDPGGPMMAVCFGWILAYIVGGREFMVSMLQPDAALWRWGWQKHRRRLWRVTGLRFLTFCLLSIPLLYNTPLYGVWILPLPSAAKALQKLADRLMKRTQASFADPRESPDNAGVPVESAVPGLHGEQVV